MCHHLQQVQHVLLSPLSPFSVPLPSFLPLPFFHELFPPRFASLPPLPPVCLCEFQLGPFLDPPFPLPVPVWTACNARYMIRQLSCHRSRPFRFPVEHLSRPSSVWLSGTVDTLSFMKFSSAMRSSSVFLCRSAESEVHQLISVVRMPWLRAILGTMTPQWF